MNNASDPRNFRTEPPPRDDMFVLVTVGLTVAAIPCFASLLSLIVELVANINAILFMTMATKAASIPFLGGALERAFGFTPADLVAGMQAVSESTFASFVHRHWTIAVIGPSAGLGILCGRVAGRPLERIKHVSGPMIYEGSAAKRAAADKLKGTDFSGEGIVVAGVRLNRDRETKGIQVIGKVGAGKTTVIRPIIQQAEARGDQLVIHDAKGGDFIRQFGPGKNGRNGLGRHAALLGQWDQRAAIWDICEEIAAYERDETGEWCAFARAGKAGLDICEEIAGIFCDVAQVKGNNAFFNGAAAKILTGMLYYHHDRYARTGVKWDWRDINQMLKQHMLEVRETIAGVYPEIGNIIEIQSDGQSAGNLSATTKNVVMTLIQTSETPIRLLARTAGDPHRARLTIAMFTRPNSKIQTIILNGNADYETAQRKIFGAFVEILGRKLAGPGYPERRPTDPGMWLILDEFPQLGRQNKIKTVMEVGRSKGIRVVLGWQAPDSQAAELYGHDGAKTILGISQTLIFGSVSASTAKWIADSAGQRVIQRWTPTGYVHDKAPAIEPIDIEQLRQDKVGVDVFMTFFEGFYRLRQDHVHIPARCPAFVPTSGTGSGGGANSADASTTDPEGDWAAARQTAPQSIAAVSAKPRVGIVDTDSRPGLVGDLAKEGGKEAAKDLLSDLVGELGS